MITFEDALTKAKKLKPEIDNYTEYENAYVFGCDADDDYEGKAPVIILKDSGKDLNILEFVAMDSGKEIKSDKL